MPKLKMTLVELATTMHGIDAEKDTYASDPGKLAVLFKEMVKICLWYPFSILQLSFIFTYIVLLFAGETRRFACFLYQGRLSNTYSWLQDLSLLTHLTPAEIQQLQSAQESRKEYILRDDADDVWAHITSLKDGRVDWALDNSGYEVRFCPPMLPETIGTDMGLCRCSQTLYLPTFSLRTRPTCRKSSFSPSCFASACAYIYLPILPFLLRRLQPEADSLVRLRCDTTGLCDAR
jgi:hypothetical protein